jgi:NitT/TauT family transport system permease protein
MPVIKLFRPARPHRPVGLGDLVVFLVVAVLIYAGVRLAFRAPAYVQGPEISLSPAALPWYAFLSTLRMLAAYVLSLAFSLFYGYKAARSRYAEIFFLPLLDVLQSVPILSFLPVAVLALTAFLPERLGVELAAIFLIFTSQAWNLTFAWYQSLITIPQEMREAGAIFRLRSYLRLRFLELPFAAIQLIWNSMMSWAGGWFFLMASEMFTVGARDYRLPGLGSYLQKAAYLGDTRALAWGLVTLIFLIVLLDQLVWRPLLAWAERFKLEMVESEGKTSSWFYKVLRGFGPLVFPLAAGFGATRSAPPCLVPTEESFGGNGGKEEISIAVLRFDGDPWWSVGAWGGLGRAVPPFPSGFPVDPHFRGRWRHDAPGDLGPPPFRPLDHTRGGSRGPKPAGRELDPAGGADRRVHPSHSPVPCACHGPCASSWRSEFGGGAPHAHGKPSGTSFSIRLRGARAIPQDLKYTARLMGLSRWQRWKILYFPALFPYLVTGAITASGGAWNASIVAEHVTFGGQTLYTVGLGAIIAQATERGYYPLLFAATLTMITLVVAINRLLWRRLYRVAEERFKLE